MEPADLLVQVLLARTARAKRAAALGPGVTPGPGDLQHSCHHGDRVVRLLLRHQLKPFRRCCLAAKKALAFPKNSFSAFRSATSLCSRAISAAVSSGVGWPLSVEVRRRRSFFDPAAEQVFAEVELLGDSPDRLSSIEDQARGVAAVLLGISASLSHVNILAQGTVAPLVWVSTTRG